MHCNHRRLLNPTFPSLLQHYLVRRILWTRLFPANIVNKSAKIERRSTPFPKPLLENHWCWFTVCHRNQKDSSTSNSLYKMKQVINFEQTDTMWASLTGAGIGLFPFAVQCFVVCVYRATEESPSTNVNTSNVYSCLEPPFVLKDNLNSHKLICSRDYSTS